MRIALVIGRRRYRQSWVEIDDVIDVDHDEVITTHGAKQIYERSRGRVHFVVNYLNGHIVGNRFETVRNVELCAGALIELD